MLLTFANSSCKDTPELVRLVIGKAYADDKEEMNLIGTLNSKELKKY